MSSDRLKGGGKELDKGSTNEQRQVAPGKQSRSDSSWQAAQGQPLAAIDGANQSTATSGVDDWEMTPELSTALGVDGIEDRESQQCLAPPQRTLASAPGWATPQSPAAATGAADASASPGGSTIAFVREEGLNLRAKPDQKSPSLLQMTFGQRVHVLEEAGSGDWLKIAVRGKTGYAYKPKLHAPPADLLAKDPGVTLIKVKSGQNFWGLVKDRYGIHGNESSKDQNINHFINAIRAVNKPEAFKIKTDLLDDVGNAVVPGRDASDTELMEGVDLWIPSFGVAAKMDVGSGTLRGEATRVVKKFEQKLDDFEDACRASGKYIPEAIGRRSGEMAAGMLQGLVDFAIDAAKILGVSSAAGAIIGSFFGGVGAAPGAAIGFEIGMLLLEYYGLAMLAEAVLGVAADLISQLGQFIALAWDANGDKVKLEKAGKALAEALGILVSALLVVASAYLMKRGANALAKTKFAQKLGQTRLAKWFEERQKGTATKEALEKDRLAKEKAAREKLEQEKAAKRAEEEKAAKEKAEQEEAAKKAEEEQAAKEKAEQEEAAKNAEEEQAAKEKAEQEEAAKKAEKEKVANEKAAAEKDGTKSGDDKKPGFSKNNKSDIPNQGTVSKVDGAPPVDCASQGKHVTGHPNNTNPAKTRWAEGVDHVTETQNAYLKGSPVPGQPQARSFNTGRSMGEGGQTWIKVHINSAGQIHGVPFQR